jgi:hypothetical protein
MQEPGQPGDGINRHNRKAELRRQLQARAPGVLKDARFGATRRSIAGKAGRCRSRGDPGDASGGVTEGRSGQPGLHMRERQRIRGEATRHSVAGRTRRCRMRGNSQPPSGGATGRAGPRGLSARRTEGCGNRGNLRLHRGPAFEMQNPGQPGDLAQG